MEWLTGNAEDNDPESFPVDLCQLKEEIIYPQSNSDLGTYWPRRTLYGALEIGFLLHRRWPQDWLFRS